jgi:putative CocE/NonD family hydrolase
VDVRGTGGSTGTALDEYSLQEHLDGVEAIAWMAAQPWCNGNVGMFGTSYGGFNSLQVAMHRPPALKAICPMYFTDNRYTDDCHYKGGAMQMLYDIGTYGLGMVVMNALPPYPEGAGDRWAATWEEHLENEPWILQWVENQVYNDYWKHGSLCEDYGAIQCAAYLFGGWRDGYTNCNLRVFEHLRGPKKALIGPWLHVAPDVGLPGPRVDHLHEMARFYEYWLKDIDNGIMAEPAITLYVQKFDPPEAERPLTSGFWRHEATWPLERAGEQAFYLAANGGLEVAPPAAEQTVSYDYNPTVGTTFGMFSAGSPLVLPMDQRLEDAYTLNWTAAPLTAPLEILGHAQAEVSVAVTTDIATLTVRLIDVAPDGTAALVTKGLLNLTHRESHENPTSLTPGQIYHVTIPLDATSWLFEPGHAVRFSIAGADFPNSWPSPKLYTGTVYYGGQYPSRLLLPVVSPQEPALPEPQLQPPTPFEPLVQNNSEKATWRVTRDHINRTAEVQMRTGGRTRLNEGREIEQERDVTCLVSEQNPGQASVRGLSRTTLTWTDRVIETQARGQIESTANAFHVTIQLDITMDGLPHFNKRWVRTYPRQLL